MTNQLGSQSSDKPIARALARAIDLGEIGVAVAAYSGNDLVVDQWVGATSEVGDRAVNRDTLFPILSVTKAMTATALHLQVERGVVDYQAPVATYWPEFAQAGKGGITVSHVLCHQSGLVAMPPESTPTLLGDWEWVTRRLAETAPEHPPGEGNAYHALNFGWLIGEVIRRTDPEGRLPCQFVRDEILAPFDVDDVWLSLPPEQDDRVATLATAGATQRDFSKATLRNVAAPSAVAPSPTVYNTTEMRRACNPSAGAIATARGVARFFAILANGGTLDSKRLLSEDRVRRFLEPRPNNRRLDQVAGGYTSVGIGGYWVRDPEVELEPLLGSGRQILYQTGAGGTIAFADLDQRLALAICHNRMFGPPPALSHPWIDLVQAVREAVTIPA